MNTKIRWAMITMVSGLTLAISSAAFACDGKHGERGEHQGAKSPEHRAERFRKDDSNHDGFLTQSEVGDRRWTRLQAADANKDSKVSLAELEQAIKDGKLKHRGPKHDKSS